MLRQRSISAVGIVLFTAIPAFLGGPVFIFAILVLALIGLREILGAFKSHGYHPFELPAYSSLAALILLAGFEAPDWTFAAVITVLVLVTLAAAVIRLGPPGSLLDWALTAIATIYVVLPLVYALTLRGIEGDSERAWMRTLAGRLGSESTSEGLAWFGLVLSITWLNDTAAYLFGRAFGRTKLVPELSPGKTRVGAVSGIVVGTLTGILAAWVFGAPINAGMAAGVGLLLSVAGQVGDLGESLIKRNLGIKDMGALIPGHGGILDRIDALLFTIPTLYLVVRLLNEAGWT